MREKIFDEDEAESYSSTLNSLFGLRERVLEGHRVLDDNIEVIGQVGLPKEMQVFFIRNFVAHEDALVNLLSKSVDDYSDLRDIAIELENLVDLLTEQNDLLKSRHELMTKDNESLRQTLKTYMSHEVPQEKPGL